MSRHVRVGWCGKSRSSALVSTLELGEGKGSVLEIQISCIIHVCMVHICSPTETKWKLVGWGDYDCGGPDWKQIFDSYYLLSRDADIPVLVKANIETKLEKMYVVCSNKYHFKQSYCSLFLLG